MNKGLSIVIAESACSKTLEDEIEILKLKRASKPLEVIISGEWNHDLVISTLKRHGQFLPVRFTKRKAIDLILNDVRFDTVVFIHNIKLIKEDSVENWIEEPSRVPSDAKCFTRRVPRESSVGNGYIRSSEWSEVSPKDRLNCNTEASEKNDIVQPKVSIIVPIYNVERYLEKCLASILSQTFKDLEVIGVDDCSQDNAARVFTQYLDDARFRLVVHAENRGLPAARTTGILNAKAEFLFFLDSDDWIAPDAIEKMYKKIVNDNVEIVIGGLARYVEMDSSVQVPSNHARLMRKNISQTSIFDCSDLFFSVTSCNKLLRRDFIVSTGLYFSEKYKRFEDILTYKWYLSGATVSTITDVTYYYTERAAEYSNPSITQQQGIDVIVDRLLAFADIFCFVDQKGLLGGEYDPLHSKQAMMNLPWNLKKTFSDLSKKDPINQCDLLKLTVAANNLFSLMSAKYINNLEPDLRSIIEIFKTFNMQLIEEKLFRNFAISG